MTMMRSIITGNHRHPSLHPSGIQFIIVPGTWRSSIVRFVI